MSHAPHWEEIPRDAYHREDEYRTRRGVLSDNTKQKSGNIRRIHVYFIIYAKSQSIYINCEYVGHQAVDQHSPHDLIHLNAQCDTQLLLNEQTHNKVKELKQSDCVYLQSKIQSLVPNFFIHNIREMLEKMSEGNEISSLAELMELSLINQSKLLCRVILDGMAVN